MQDKEEKGLTAAQNKNAQLSKKQFIDFIQENPTDKWSEFPNENNDNALHLIAKFNLHGYTFRLLQDHKYKRLVDVHNRQGFTPFQVAQQYQSTVVLQEIIELQAFVAGKDKFSPPVRALIDGNDSEIRKLLFHYTPDSAHANENLLEIFVIFKKEKLVELILKEYGAVFCQLYIIEAICKAAKFNNKSILSLFSKHCSRYNADILIASINYGTFGTVRYVLEHCKADVSRCDESKRHPLLAAASSTYLATWKFVYGKGRKISSLKHLKDGTSNNMLHYSVMKARKETLVLDQVIDELQKSPPIFSFLLNSQNIFAPTLHAYFVQCDFYWVYLSVFRSQLYEIEKKLRIPLQDVKKLGFVMESGLGFMPAHKERIAIEKKYKNPKFLNGSPPDLTPLMVAILLLNETGALTLLAHDLDLEIQDAFGNTALHLSSMMGLIPVVKKLLSKGANRSALNQNNKTPKDLATDNNHSTIEKIFKLLEFTDRMEGLLSDLRWQVEFANTQNFSNILNEKSSVMFSMQQYIINHARKVEGTFQAFKYEVNKEKQQYFQGAARAPADDTIKHHVINMPACQRSSTVPLQAYKINDERMEKLNSSLEVNENNKAKVIPKHVTGARTDEIA